MEAIVSILTCRLLVNNIYISFVGDYIDLKRTFLLGTDQPAMDAVQQRQEAVADRHRAGQDALRSQPAAAKCRQAQGELAFLKYSPSIASYTPSK